MSKKQDDEILLRFWNQFSRKAKTKDAVKRLDKYPQFERVTGRYNGCVSLRLVQEIGNIRGTQLGDIDGFFRDIETAKAIPQ